METVKQTATESGLPRWYWPRAAYVHVPFCYHRCGYCDFATVAGQDQLADAYLDALAAEMATLGANAEVDTIFVGGGTPTHLQPQQLERLLRAIRDRFSLADGYEFTVEANPGTLDTIKVRLLAEFGVNRVSLGAQSFHKPLLAVLERNHDPVDVPRAIELLRTFVPRLSIDLIFGVPGQTLAQWQSDLRQALALGVAHLSVYGLTYEKGTPLWKQRERGEVTPVDEDAECAFFGMTMNVMAEAGFEHYEISNYARPGQACRHNLVYWANEAYFGSGLGAARYVRGVREINTRDLQAYLGRINAGGDATQQSEQLTPAERARETAVLQVRRLREGIERFAFREQSGYDVDVLLGSTIARFVEQGLLDDNGDRIVLTRQGTFLADTVASQFLVGQDSDPDRINAVRIGIPTTA